VTYTFAVSENLRSYAEAVKEWGAHPHVREFARQLDGGPAAPHPREGLAEELKEKVRASAPPPTPPGPFDDPAPVIMATMAEALSYSDGLFGFGLIGAGTTFSSGGGLLGHVLSRLGTDEQKEHWREVLAKPGVRTAFALTEHGFGSDTSLVTTTAVRDGDMWVINGTKMYCTGGAVADYLAVFATIDKSQGAAGIKAFIVPTTTPGFKVLKYNEDKLGIRNAVTSELGFEDCAVPLDYMLGWTDGETGTPAQMPSGRSGALAALSMNRPNISAAGAGTAQAAIDLARSVLEDERDSYTLERWTKIQNELDLMDAAIARVRRVVLKAQWMAAEKISNNVEASTAKAYGPPTFEKIIRRCMQFLGHEGTSHLHLLEKWYRDVKIQDIFEGSGQIQRIVISRDLFGGDPERP
jgi:acyl-CoA dehydrogenase